MVKRGERLALRIRQSRLVPVAAGRELAQLIAGAESDFIPGMGHDLPLALITRLADGLARNARR